MEGRFSRLEPSAAGLCTQPYSTTLPISEDKYRELESREMCCTGALPSKPTFGSQWICSAPLSQPLFAGRIVRQTPIPPPLSIPEGLGEQPGPAQTPPSTARDEEGRPSQMFLEGYPQARHARRHVSSLTVGEKRPLKSTATAAGEEKCSGRKTGGLATRHLPKRTLWKSTKTSPNPTLAARAESGRPDILRPGRAAQTKPKPPPHLPPWLSEADEERASTQRCFRQNALPGSAGGRFYLIALHGLFFPDFFHPALSSDFLFNYLFLKHSQHPAARSPPACHHPTQLVYLDPAASSSKSDRSHIGVQNPSNSHSPPLGH